MTFVSEETDQRMSTLQGLIFGFFIFDSNFIVVD
jgi:hypothetical protein